MADGIMNKLITAVIHLPKELAYPVSDFINLVQSLLDQYDQSLEVIIMDEGAPPEIRQSVIQINNEGNSISFLTGNFRTRGEWMNAALNQANGDFLLYLDNSHHEISLKHAAATTLLLTAERNPGAGMIYSDFELENNGEVKEIRLLKHHEGRVRDNQNYGQLAFFAKAALRECGGFDESLQFNTMYDIRLKLGEKHKLIHLSNKYSGSLYRVVSEGKSHNVFDYLLASKDSQIEAENVLSGHLQRIGAYLEAGEHYSPRPEPSPESTLDASIIIPVNNRAAFIPTAIESVLAQSRQNIEIIVVVNGGADDPTIAKVKEYMPGGTRYDAAKPEVRMIVLDINNIGLCLNLGARAARGKYYVQLDSDDRLKKDAVEKILAVFDSDPLIGMVIGSYEVWQLDDKSRELNRVESIPVVTHDEWTEENGRNNLLRINGAGAPRSIPIKLIKDIGYFGINDEPFARNYGEDYEMVLKISEKHRIGRVWDPIYEVIRHSGGTDHSIDQNTIDLNDNAKDYMRAEAIGRRILLNAR
jgi:glycosyltransferase involved in cell wall biosynthesis